MTQENRAKLVKLFLIMKLHEAELREIFTNEGVYIRELERETISINELSKAQDKYYAVDDALSYIGDVIENIGSALGVEDITAADFGRAFISIEDTMNVLVKYENGAIMSYSLNAFSPIEGFRVTFTGTKGRLELQVGEKSYVNAGGDAKNEGATKTKSIVVYPQFGTPYEVDIPEGVGGHGGGDPILQRDIFGEPEYDEFHRAASHVDGAMSILTGIAANKSIATGMPVNIKDLVTF